MDAIKELKDLLPVVLFLLPGFISTGIVGMLVIRKERETFDKVVEAVILTTINLVLFELLQHSLERILHVRFDHQDFFTPGNLILMAFCAVSIGLAWAAEANNDWLFKRLRAWGITKKTSHVSTWNETFHDNAKFIVVHLKDGRRVYGYPTYYSDDPVERAIFLEDATWLSPENTPLNTPSIGIFLDKESGIEVIEFKDFDPEKKPEEAKQDQANLSSVNKNLPTTSATLELNDSTTSNSDAIPPDKSLPLPSHHYEQTKHDGEPQRIEKP